MQIEVWSDFVCPFCYIGKRKLEKALRNFEHREKVNIVFRSFELNPYAPKEGDETFAEIIAAKYGVSLEQAQAMCANMAAQAKQEGLDYRFETMIPHNTFDAHRLLHYAADHGKMDEMSERLYCAFFTESKDIADHNTLIDIAVEMDLDGSDVLDMLTSDQYTVKVRDDEALGSKLGVKGVPYFIFAQKYAVSGAQSVTVFEEVLDKAWSENVKIEEFNSGGGSCAADSCNMPS
ncbi:DsbA family oxidoreductase [Mechercharimyces sp. CAU 1602]|uniref:DsbA family oxidoreductase n=1 Tax=Mechercharimyces sp. CAU 1602 TaxID=2973933 RepID=UPI002161A9BD|nr:DsbA family oxidoreductase [Mechercharimyces sp. CAU 1602]MCS1352553.1 DsbA family oxidoreductase [Mechercharimyces sp. CAU 1602]